METSVVEEFRWNLKRLMREVFPEGIPLIALSASYSVWLTKSVEPNSIISGCDSWEIVFRDNALLKETFYVTEDDVPHVRIKGGNEMSEEELKDVLEMTNYASMDIEREYRRARDNTSGTDAAVAVNPTSSLNGLASVTGQYEPTPSISGLASVVSGQNGPTSSIPKKVRKRKIVNSQNASGVTPAGSSNSPQKRTIPDYFDAPNSAMKRLSVFSNASPEIVPPIPGQSTSQSQSTPTSTNRRNEVDNIVENSPNTNGPISLQTDDANEPSSSISSVVNFPVRNQDQDICDVCNLPGTEEGVNEMMTCDTCKVCVHQACYGILNPRPDHWICQTCLKNIKRPCILCPNRGGAMKPTNWGNEWAHLSCGLWIPELTVQSVSRMEPIINITAMPKRRWQKPCSLCKILKGACVQCDEKDCENYYHVTCGFKYRVIMNCFQGERRAVYLLKSYCAIHSEERRAKRRKRREQSRNQESEDQAPGTLNANGNTNQEEINRQVVPEVPNRPYVPELLSATTYGLQNEMLLYPRFLNNIKFLDIYNSRFKITTLRHVVEAAARKLSVLVSHGSKIYDIGGTMNIDSAGDLRNEDKLCSTITDIFKSRQQDPGDMVTILMVEARKIFAACVCGNYLYAIGGIRRNTAINHAERLDLDKQLNAGFNWEPIRGMPEPRAGHGVAVLDNMIYVIGGFNQPLPGGGQIDCSTVMQYNPSSNNWGSISPMNEARAHVKTVVMNNSIYAVGGDVSEYGSETLMHKNRRSLKTVEVYSTEWETWSYCTNMNRARSCGMVVVQKNLLYAIGGDSKVNPTMEVYDPRIEKWILLDWPLNLTKDAELSSAIVIDI